MKTIMDQIHRPPLERADKCDTHGTFSARCYLGTVWTKCPGCALDAEAAEKAKEQERMQAQRRAAWERKLDVSCIPERFRDRTLASYQAAHADQVAALAFAQGYADDFDAVAKTGRSAIFLGKPGTGKTHLAVGIGLQIMRKRKTVLFVTVMRAIRRIKDTWSRDSETSEAAAIASLVFPDLLILDEVGVQFGSETEKVLLFDVLNERYEQRRPTILLSNLSIDGVRQYLGERIFDRLREDGGAVIPFNWSSHRGAA